MGQAEPLRCCPEEHAQPCGQTSARTKMMGPGRTPQPSAVPRTHQQPLQQGGRLGKGYICTKAPTVRERSIGDGPGDTMAIETQLENQQE